MIKSKQDLARYIEQDRLAEKRHGGAASGGIRVGDNVIIGANAVVLKDVPNNAIVAGIPAKVVRYINQ